MSYNLFRNIAVAVLLLITGCSHKIKTSDAQNLLLTSECILEVNNFKQIEDIINNLQGKIWVAIDNNDVLTRPGMQILTTQNRPQFKEVIKEEIPKKISDRDYQLFMSSLFVFTKPVLVDDYAPSFIKKLQKQKNTKVMLFTNCFIGRYGIIKKYESFLEKRIKELGINFSKNWNKSDNRVLTKLSSERSKTFKSSKHYPIFYNGMLIANSVAKGKVMHEFLTKRKNKPDVLVFIDDSQQKLMSVKEYMDKLNVNCVLIKFSHKK